MRLYILPLIVASFALAACESTPQDASAAAGEGASATGQPVTTAAATPQPSVTSTPVAPGERPGSVQDFVVNVGDRVFFGFDRYDLSPEARDTIERQVTWLQRYPQVTVTVEGHADERGTREYNLALGERRANSVRNYMIALGVEPNRVSTISYGKERPVDPASNEAAWAKNRRGVTVVNNATISLAN
jgi:peptidoglycan-associated lipoprotein